MSHDKDDRYMVTIQMPGQGLGLEGLSTAGAGVLVGVWPGQQHAVLYTTQCLGTGSVLVHPVQWPKATEFVHGRMCLKKLTLASWTGLLGHHSGLRPCDGQRSEDVSTVGDNCIVTGWKVT